MPTTLIVQNRLTGVVGLKILSHQLLISPPSHRGNEKLEKKGENETGGKKNSPFVVQWIVSL